MKNFEEITHEITDEEKQIAEDLCQILKKKTGKNNALTNKDLRLHLEVSFNKHVTGPRLRKVIQFIRLNGLLNGLIATSSGYWITEDPEELNSWIESMKERENAVRASRQAGERDLFLLQSNTVQTKLFE